MITSLYLTYMSGTRTTSSIMQDIPAVKHKAQPTPEKQQPVANTPQNTSGAAHK